MLFDADSNQVSCTSCQYRAHHRRCTLIGRTDDHEGMTQLTSQAFTQA
jgi:hypothetical protein